ncbi:type I restriction enzyme R subunit [Spinactinospora alkalitolerans]|uniref:type I site-specific deoxyribonuclease n=1 Tax=Spinactinospora alkalitolerans TaxID=687207 RepID=A0A852TX56_9ACTN|nr:type I restriction endonuclease [Spinactinospora alkalitolerans]NYE48311.1 type I restriction enzyme R subunit [Spinactinospora alkalitolerans]
MEKPLIDQLVAMGWIFLPGTRTSPADTGRTSFRETVLEDRLKAALRRINLDDAGREWLDESRLNQAVGALTRPQARTLIETNEELIAKILVGAEVEGVEGWNHGRTRTVRFIDFEQPDNNDFLAVNQFAVDGPGAVGADRIVPDLVLFVNGIPLVVVEAKSPHVADPVAAAIDQLRRYANQRGEVRAAEGNERLFHTNQFVVAASGRSARVAGFTAESEHYAEWKTTEPYPDARIAAEAGVSGTEELNGRHRLVAGMLRPAVLLDIVAHFTLFMESGPRKIKVVARYQQYRAVRRSIDRMLGEPTRAQDGEFDRRGGIVWHTQGSGKSLTMVFLVRAMRSRPRLTGFKIVVITDRTQLQEQLSATMALTGESSEVITRIAEVEERLSVPGKGLYFAMIQKYQGDAENNGADADSADEEEADTAGGAAESSGEDAGPRAATVRRPRRAEIVPTMDLIDDSEDILILVDEAHRSQGSKLHANLMAALPNAVRIGFSGTPIIMGDKERFTSKIFGAFIDSYTIKESEADGATVPILYEGRTTKAHVRDGNDLDEVFEDLFDATPAQLDEIKRKYATKNNVLEAEHMIEAKADSMLRHYVDVVLPNGFKAQVVAVSRAAAVRYQKALVRARDALVAELDALPAELRTPEAAERADEHGPATARLVRAYLHRDLISRLGSAAVISGAHNDNKDWTVWTDKTRQAAHIEEFKKLLPLAADADPAETSPLAFLVVKSMLLTGFDAPNEQVLYLDRHIKEAELLQAVARVNRTAKAKRAGYVIDYFGVAEHLKVALAAYAAEDVEGALSSVKDEIPLLRERHERMRRVFTIRGLDRFASEADREECVQVLEDDRIRMEFLNAFREFTRSLETVLPRPEAREFVGDAKAFGAIAEVARRRYREDDGFDASLYGGKVRRLIDDYVRVHDIRTRIPPTAITAAEFDTKVADLPSDRAKASEMQHALRYHINENIGTDPEHYARFSERLDRILDSLGENWPAVLQALQELKTDILAGRQGDDSGLDPDTEAPFYDLLVAELDEDGDSPLAEELKRLLGEITVEVSRTMHAEIGLAGYSPHRARQLRKQVTRALAGYRLNGITVIDLPRAKSLAPRLVDLAEKRFG